MAVEIIEQAPEVITSPDQSGDAYTEVYPQINAFEPDPGADQLPTVPEVAAGDAQVMYGEPVDDIPREAVTTAEPRHGLLNRVRSMRTRMGVLAYNAGWLVMGVNLTGSRDALAEKVRSNPDMNKLQMAAHVIAHEPAQLAQLAWRLYSTIHGGAGAEHMQGVLPDHSIGLAAATHVLVHSEVQQLPDGLGVASAPAAGDHLQEVLRQTAASGSPASAPPHEVEGNGGSMTGTGDVPKVPHHDVWATGSAPSEDLHYEETKGGGVTVHINLHEGQTFIHGHEVNLAKKPLEAKITANINGREVSIIVPMVDGKLEIPPGLAADAIKAHEVTVQIFAAHGNRAWIFSTAEGNGHEFHVDKSRLFKFLHQGSGGIGGSGANGSPDIPSGHGGGGTRPGALGTPDNHLDVSYDATFGDHKAYFVTNHDGTVTVVTPAHDWVTTGRNIPEFLLHDTHSDTPVAIPEQDFNDMSLGHNALSQHDMRQMSQLLNPTPYHLRIVHEEGPIYKIEDEETKEVIAVPPHSSSFNWLEAWLGIGSGVAAAASLFFVPPIAKKILDRRHVRGSRKIRRALATHAHH